MEKPAHKRTTLVPKRRLVFVSKKMEQMVRSAMLFARTDFSVLITGESGTGKDILAEMLHNNSRRCNGPFEAINCAALQDTLVESELFGHEKGAFAGAKGRKFGLLEVADEGTFFMDEVAEASPQVQAKLLRATGGRRSTGVGRHQFNTHILGGSL